MIAPVEFTIYGEPASKANSRIAVPRKAKSGKVFIAFVKSEKAQDYARKASIQIPVIRPLLTGPLVISLRIYYASQRPDLDPSLIFDLLQDRIFTNDRQLREMHIYHGIDKTIPRAEISIRQLVPELTLDWETEESYW